MGLVVPALCSWFWIWSSLAHISPRENRNPPQAIVDAVFHLESQDDSSPAPGVEESPVSHDAAGDRRPLNDSAPVTTNVDCFDVIGQFRLSLPVAKHPRDYDRRSSVVWIKLCDNIQYVITNAMNATGLRLYNGKIT